MKRHRDGTITSEPHWQDLEAEQIRRRIKVAEEERLELPQIIANLQQSLAVPPLLGPNGEKDGD